MKQFNINNLKSTLQLNFKWKNSRLRLLSGFITSLILVCTINLTKIAPFLNTRIKTSSSYRSLQRFFKNFKIDYREYMHFVLKILPKQEKFFLVMDRTNWKFGHKDINILMLGIIYKHHCFPFCWELLHKQGSSSTQERKQLLSEAISVLGKDRIRAILCDREFIGVRWFGYLLSESIDFHIRLPKHIKAGSILKQNRKTVSEIFRIWKLNVKVSYPKQVNIFGYKLWLSGMKTEKDSCIVVSSNNDADSLGTYQLRWTIENMFGAFKSRGFNFEDTHLKDYEKLKKLIALVSIAYIWCIMVGLWVSESIKIRIATHGRKERSIFRTGLDYLVSFIKKLLSGDIYNYQEANTVIRFLSCT